MPLKSPVRNSSAPRYLPLRTPLPARPFRRSGSAPVTRSVPSKVASLRPVGDRRVTLLAPARTTEYVLAGSRVRSPACVAPVNDGAGADSSSTRIVGAGDTVASPVPW